MFIIRMDKNTNLYAISPKKLYIGESHADIIQFIIPPKIGVYDLNILMPVLHYVNVDGLDKTAELHYADDYKDQMSFVTSPTADMMAHGGPYPIWLEWVDQDYNFVFKSGCMHLHIETTIPENDREDIDYNEAAALNHHIEQLTQELNDVTTKLLQRIFELEDMVDELKTSTPTLPTPSVENAGDALTVLPDGSWGLSPASGAMTVTYDGEGNLAFPNVSVETKEA